MEFDLSWAIANKIPRWEMPTNQLIHVLLFVMPCLLVQVVQDDGKWHWIEGKWQHSTQIAKWSSSSPITPNRRSALLEHVRKTQVEALENRTQARVKELLQGATMSPQGGGAPESVTRSAIKLSPAESVKRGSDVTNLPNTEVRRNVTQRRSRGRARDEGEQAPLESLLSRRPRSRSKDRRYSVESSGETADCERQDWRSAGARFQPSGAPRMAYQTVPYSMYDPDQGLRINLDRVTPRSEKGAEKVWEDQEETRDLGDTSHARSYPAYRVPSSTGVSEGVVRPHGFQPPRNPTMPFLKEYIPRKLDNPELHDFLVEKWYERQVAVRGLGDALAEDDLERYCLGIKYLDIQKIISRYVLFLKLECNFMDLDL